MTLLAIDPGRSAKGDRTIGFCLFANENGIELLRGQLNWEELCKFLRPDPEEEGLLFFVPNHGWFDITEVVCENFVNDPQSARGGQPNGTSECIGAVEILATQAGVPFTRQASSVLYDAKLHAGYVQKLKHLPHADSAFLHGHEYLIRKGVLDVPGLEATLG